LLLKYKYLPHHNPVAKDSKNTQDQPNRTENPFFHSLSANVAIDHLNFARKIQYGQIACSAKSTSSMLLRTWGTFCQMAQLQMVVSHTHELLYSSRYSNCKRDTEV
jgi:hypothetical protein